MVSWRFGSLDWPRPWSSGDSAWRVYVSSFYFCSYTLTSVGYGDLGPKNILERIVCTGHLEAQFLKTTKMEAFLRSPYWVEKIIRTWEVDTIGLPNSWIQIDATEEWCWRQVWLGLTFLVKFAPLSLTSLRMGLGTVGWQETNKPIDDREMSWHRYLHGFCIGNTRDVMYVPGFGHTN